MAIQCNDILWNKLAQTLIDGEPPDDVNEQDPSCVRVHSPFLLEKRTKMLKQLGKFIKDREFDIGTDDISTLVHIIAPLTGSQAVHAVLGAQLLVDFEPCSKSEESELKEVLTPAFVDNVFKENEADSVQDLINRLPIETADAMEAYLQKIVEESTYASIFQGEDNAVLNSKQDVEHHMVWATLYSIHVPHGGTTTVKRTNASSRLNSLEVSVRNTGFTARKTTSQLVEQKFEKVNACHEVLGLFRLSIDTKREKLIKAKLMNGIKTRVKCTAGCKHLYCSKVLPKEAKCVADLRHSKLDFSQTFTQKVNYKREFSVKVPVEGKDIAVGFAVGWAKESGLMVEYNFKNGFAHYGIPPPGKKNINPDGLWMWRWSN
jgi:hypothetical protein